MESLNLQIVLCLASLLLLLCTVQVDSVLKEGECEVCIKTLDKFAAKLSDDVKKDPKLIETEFKKFCKTSKTKENRFCYYLGGLEESATGILNEVTKPISWSMPSDKICEKLKKKDAQICDLRFGKYFENASWRSLVLIIFFKFSDKQIDLKTVDLKKLKVRDLKKILNDWDETCDGCLEKTDFIKRIEELKPQYMHTELWIVQPPALVEIKIFEKMIWGVLDLRIYSVCSVFINVLKSLTVFIFNEIFCVNKQWTVFWLLLPKMSH